MYKVDLDTFVKEFNLERLLPDISLEGKIITKSEVNRPALQMAGFFEHFDCDRVQVIGKVEYTYISKLDPQFRKKVLRQTFSYHIPCLIICYGLTAFPEMLELAEEFNVPIFSTSDSTSDFMAEVIRWLKAQLAERITLHGVLVDIYGEGTLIIGESGIGKSETALELIKRGHRLVADDAVEIKRISHNTLSGTCPELIRYFIEVRGIGIINVRELFGVGSIKQMQNIDLVLKLEMWNDEEEYDRLGLNEDYMEILGNQVPCYSIPIRPGRNTAVICESAAMNHRQKKLGYNAAQILNERVFNSLNPPE